MEFLQVFLRYRTDKNRADMRSVTLNLTLTTKINQVILDYKWTFVTILKKYPQGVPVITCSQEWDGQMGQK